MNPRVTKARASGEHEVLVDFSNGETRRLDLQPLFDYEVRAKLKDPAFLARVRADHGTLAWPEGIDLDPETVYLDSVPVGILAKA